jgi:hypothetical protein
MSTTPNPTPESADKIDRRLCPFCGVEKLFVWRGLGGTGPMKFSCMDCQTEIPYQPESADKELVWTRATGTERAVSVGGFQFEIREKTTGWALFILFNSGCDIEGYTSGYMEPIHYPKDEHFACVDEANRLHKAIVAALRSDPEKQELRERIENQKDAIQVVQRQNNALREENERLTGCLSISRASVKGMREMVDKEVALNAKLIEALEGLLFDALPNGQPRHDRIVAARAALAEVKPAKVRADRKRK